MANQPQQMLNFVALALLLCAAAAQIVAERFNGSISSVPSREFVKPAAICGNNSLQSSSFCEVCSLVSYWRNVKSTTCSGWIVGSRYIATAGHCIYNQTEGTFATSVEVYCNANAGCKGPLTTTHISLSVTSEWERGNTDINSPDGGIIKTKDVLPFAALPWDERIGDYQTSVIIAGYPKKDGITNSSCNAPAYTGCAQFSTTGPMAGVLDEGVFLPDIDACPGHSGSPSFDRELGKVTGILVADDLQPCRNYVVPLRTPANVDDGCNGAGGGVGIDCLIKKADLNVPSCTIDADCEFKNDECLAYEQENDCTIRGSKYRCLDRTCGCGRCYS